MVNLKKNSERPIVKRRLATVNGCLNDLEEELPMLFNAFEEACNKFNMEIQQTPPSARQRGFEAQLFNCKLIQGIQEYFPEDWKFGKYRRFYLQSNGYLILFKKLNNKGMPMSIKTKIVESINLQLTKSLFEDSSFAEEPILYFGYRKDRIGNLCQPQLIYIDENKVRWTIVESEIKTVKTIGLEKHAEPIATPKLRTVKRKAVNE